MVQSVSPGTGGEPVEVRSVLGTECLHIHRIESGPKYDYAIFVRLDLHHMGRDHPAAPPAKEAWSPDFCLPSGFRTFHFLLPPLGEIDMQSTLDKAYKTRELARVQLRALGVLVYLRAAHLFPSRSQRDGVVRVRF